MKGKLLWIAILGVPCAAGAQLVTERTLSVNAAPFMAGEPFDSMRVTVEILSADKKQIEKHDFPPTKDASIIWHTFKPGHALPKQLRLRFRVRNCKLYSFRIHM